MSDLPIIPLTQARANLGNLTKKVQGRQYIILTKGGQPKVALVDVGYLQKLETTLKKLYQKTYIDPKLLPLTRRFSDVEISKWGKDDQL